MTVYAVKIRDKISGKFLNMQGHFTRVGRTFNSLAYAKTSVSGKLDLKNMQSNMGRVPYLEGDIKLYLGCDFVLYTDEGEKSESIQEYILKYLREKSSTAAVDYVKGLCQ